MAEPSKDEKELGHAPYAYSQQQQQPIEHQHAVSPELYVAETFPPQAVSPQATSPASLANIQQFATIQQQNTAWLDPQSPNLRDTPGYDRNYDSHKGLMGNEPTEVPYPKPSGGNVHRRSTTIALPKSGPLWLRIAKSPWSMIFCLTIGVAGAIGHHFLYNHLDGNEAMHQKWWLRLGQLIAFISNANFVLAAMMAHQQIAWRAVGQRGFSIQAVDSIFGATHNLAELFNKEVWTKSWFVMLLAIFMWISPLVVILTSATLDVVPGQRVVDTFCPSIRTLNFSNEAKESYQTPKKAEGEVMNGRSLALYNVTAAGGNLADGAADDDDIFEYYGGPSPSLVRIATSVFSSDQIIQKKNESTEICGDGWDCSATVHFVGPGYKCEELANGVGSKMKSFGGDADPPFELDELAPASNYTYMVNADRGEYMMPQMDDVQVGGIPSEEDGPPFPKNLGVFRTEPAIWVGYTAVDDFTKAHAMNSSQDGWNDDYTPIIFACDHWEVNYTVTFNWTAGFMAYNISDRDYKRKIIDTNWVESTKNSTDGTADTNIAEPEDNYVSPRKDFGRYRRIAAYHSLGLKLRQQLAGRVYLEDSVKADGLITSTNLLDRHESLPQHDFQKVVRRVYEDLLISLLSDPQLLAVAWAADPSKLSGTGVGGEDTNYKCERRRTANYFEYDWVVLAVVYSVSFILASIGVYYGIDAMSSDGTNAQRVMTFSAIAGATKSVSLDQVEKRETKIRCFPVDERSGDRQYEFRAELPG